MVFGSYWRALVVSGCKDALGDFGLGSIYITGYKALVISFHCVFLLP